jgi:serine/threonine protein kinase
MNLNQQNIGNLLVDGRFYESIQGYQPERRDFINLTQFYLSKDWTIGSKGVWVSCTARDYVVPSEGWKLHVSATPYNSRSVLLAALPVLMRFKASFKFPLDKRVLALMSGKLWPRGGSGKFITVYPSDQEHFFSLADALHAATRRMVGPYILSDRRYKKEHSVVFYRYGTMNPTEEVSLSGAPTSFLHSPGGEKIRDDRRPSFQVPGWVTDPVPPEPADDAQPNSLNGGRYLVRKALSFSNTGGVYLATDTLCDRSVVIKEARAYVGGVSPDNDAVSGLHKEYRILTRLANTGLAPKPIEFFSDWENSYLVEEYVEGTLLSELAASESPLRRGASSIGADDFYQGRFKNIFTALANGVKKIHSCNIALFDLSPNNVFVTDDGKGVVFIDFEASCDLDIDAWSGLATPGFTPKYPDPARIVSQPFSNDYYALAALMLAFIFPCNQFLQEYPKKLEPVVREVCRDALVPSAVADIMIAALQETIGNDAYISAVADTLQSAGPNSDRDETRSGGDFCTEAARRIPEIQSFMLGNSGNFGYDRLFPCHAQAYLTNPLSLGFAAYGTVFALCRSGIPFDGRWGAWIDKYPISNQTYSHGFLVGQAGMAWVLSEIGDFEKARALLANCFVHPLLWNSSDLYEGAAGCALAMLRVFLSTENEQSLEQAVSIVEKITSIAKTDEQGGMYWQDRADRRYAGLAYGSSGIALLYLYLSLLLSSDRYLALALRCVEHDTRRVASMDELQGRSTARSAKDGKPLDSSYRRGLAGIGTVILKLKAFCGVSAFDEELESIYLRTDAKYAMASGKFDGLAGIAGFRYDALRITGEVRHRDALERLLEGLRLFEVQYDGGMLAYASNTSGKLSCDYGHGTAGILCLYHRLKNDRPDELSLDEHFEPRIGKAVDRIAAAT